MRGGHTHEEVGCRRRTSTPLLEDPHTVRERGYEKVILEVVAQKCVFSQMFKQLSFQYVGSVSVQSFCNCNEWKLNEVEGSFFV